MYLLNLNGCGVICTIQKKFTFHYVSIKSIFDEFINAFYKSFTFHYVSIKSQVGKVLGALVLIFTFHYVSIKSIR